MLKLIRKKYIVLDPDKNSGLNHLLFSYFRLIKKIDPEVTAKLWNGV